MLEMLLSLRWTAGVAVIVMLLPLIYCRSEVLVLSMVTIESRCGQLCLS